MITGSTKTLDSFLYIPVPVLFDQEIDCSKFLLFFFSQVFFTSSCHVLRSFKVPPKYDARLYLVVPYICPTRLSLASVSSVFVFFIYSFTELVKSFTEMVKERRIIARNS